MGWLWLLGVLSLGRAEAPPTPAAQSLRVVVFCDDDGDGLLGSGETGRVPGVRVEIAGLSAVTAEGTGRAEIAGVAPGSHELRIAADSLPPFYLPPDPLAVRVPVEGEIGVPVRLPVGPNRPQVYLAFGDSITEGDGSSDEAGYVSRLERRLKAYFGRAEVVNAGASGTNSHRGARRAAEALARHRPGYALVLYGTNDWDESGHETVTLNSLRRIVEQAKAARSLPFLATLPPTWPGADPRASEERNAWVDRINARIRELARAEGAVLVDVHARLAVDAAAPGLFADGLHPNDAGYQAIADVFFEAITRPPADR